MWSPPRAPNPSPLQSGITERRGSRPGIPLLPGNLAPYLLSGVYPAQARGCENRRFSFLAKWLGAIGSLWAVLSVSSPDTTFLHRENYFHKHLPPYCPQKLIMLYVYYFSNSLLSKHISVSIISSGPHLLRQTGQVSLRCLADEWAEENPPRSHD